MTPEKRLARLITHPTSLENLWATNPLSTDDIEVAKNEGIYPLLCYKITSTIASENCKSPEIFALLERMKRANYQAAAQELEIFPALTQAISCIRQESPVLLKGVVLSCFYYAETFLRPMQDIDFIIEPHSANSVSGELEKIEFCHENNTFGGVTMSQFILTKRLESGGALALDVHTQAFNGPALFDLLPYSDLLENATNEKILDQEVLIPCTVHCLAHAIIHMMAHHKNSRKLIWLYDVSILANSLTSEDTKKLIQYAKEKRVAKILFSGFLRCDEYFPFQQRSLYDKLDQLSQIQGRNCHPATALLLDSSRGNRFITDWKSLSSKQGKLMLIKEHLIPDYRYIQDKYQVQSFPAVIACYLWRIVKGSVRLLLTKS